MLRTCTVPYKSKDKMQLLTIAPRGYLLATEEHHLHHRQERSIIYIVVRRGASSTSSSGEERHLHRRQERSIIYIVVRQRCVCVPHCYQSYPEKKAFRCARKGCQKVVSLRTGTFFENSNLPLEKVLRMLHLWSTTTPLINMRMELEVR